MNKRQFLKTGLVGAVLGLFTSKIFANKDIDKTEYCFSYNIESTEEYHKILFKNKNAWDLPMLDRVARGNEKHILDCLLFIGMVKIAESKSGGFDNKNFRQELFRLRNTYKLQIN
jgi:hypothetical protein